MTGLPSKADCIAGLRVEMARALARIAADYAAGRLSPEDAAWVEEQRAKYRPQPGRTAA